MKQRDNVENKGAIRPVNLNVNRKILHYEQGIMIIDIFSHCKRRGQKKYFFNTLQKGLVSTCMKY